MELIDITLILLILALGLTILYARNRNGQLAKSVAETKKLTSEKQTVEEKLKGYETRFSAVFDMDAEIKVLSSDKQSLEADKQSLDDQITRLRQDYKDKRTIYDDLVRHAAIYDEEIELAELGFYKPHYDFDTSERYKAKINSVREQQKSFLKDKKAIYCTTNWTVDGSRSKGRKKADQAIRLTTRAFNNECDAATSSVRWNNASRMEKRIEKAFDAINKLNESQYIVIARGYFYLKLEELRLTHEYRGKRQQEKEEQAEIRRQIREDAKLEKEMAEAAKAEEDYEAMLRKAEAAAEQATGNKLAKLQDQIASLTEKLEEAHEKNERAKSMAQQTKAGHVYVLSNIGAFGENVYKIGMTRRLDPLDRVKELGDASVPFRFDTHAMIYSNNAPKMEKSLHQVFEDRRMNLVNTRREFFNVTLAEISQEVSKVAPDAEIILTAEAREYKESKAIQVQRANITTKPESEFPDAI